MVILVNSIPISLLNRDFDIYIQPCSVEHLKKFNKTEPFTLYDKGLVMYSEMSKHFKNLQLCDERTLSIDCHDTLIFVIKTSDGPVFNQLVIH